MTLTGMLTSDVSILIVPFASTSTGVLSARGLVGRFSGSLSESFGYGVTVCGDCAGCDLRPDCATLHEFITQTKTSANRITTKQRATRLLFIIPPRKFM